MDNYDINMNDEEYDAQSALHQIEIAQLEARIAQLTFQLRIQRRNQIKKVTLVQKQWKMIYQNRVKCANIIKKTAREAIANPNTQLCKNRLLHEFYDLHF